MKYIVALILLLSIGCSTPIERFDKLHSDVMVRGLTVKKILQLRFTAEAYEAIKDIPVVESGRIKGALAGGTNFWSKVLGFFMGVGIDRVVVLSPQIANGPHVEQSIIHEYTHQLHDMQLDGEGDWIDEVEFERRYEQLAHDQVYAGIVHMVERRANYWITNVFGINDLSEYIAYTGAHCATHNCPDYIGAVFRKIYGKFQLKEDLGSR
jgi:hypothetical protein